MIYVMTGQTATGKTARALELAQIYNGELINADSRQVYTGLDIVTGKDLDLTTHTFTSVQKSEQFDIGYYETTSSMRIWLYDVLSPKNPFSAFDFVRLAKTVISDIRSRGKTPIIVGGTYFYISQLLYGASSAGEPNWEIRKELSTKSIEELQEILSLLDTNLFQSLNQSERRNPQRLIRKIEIIKTQGAICSTSSREMQFTEVEIRGLCHREKHNLEEKIRARVLSRLEKGALEEVQNLVRKGYSMQDPGIKTIGYPQIISHLAGDINYEGLIKAWTTKEIQYAKRQMTLMKSDSHIQWSTV